jgi:hypothetical protein
METLEMEKRQKEQRKKTSPKRAAKMEVRKAEADTKAKAVAKARQQVVEKAQKVAKAPKPDPRTLRIRQLVEEQRSLREIHSLEMKDLRTSFIKDGDKKDKQIKRLREDRNVAWFSAAVVAIILLAVFIGRGC